MTRSTWFRRMPWSIVVLTVSLMVLGWLGIARSQHLAGTSGHYLEQQICWSAICLTVMMLVTVPSYQVLSRYSYAALTVSLVLLVVVFAFPTVNGAAIVGFAMPASVCNLRNSRNSRSFSACRGI